MAVQKKQALKVLLLVLAVSSVAWISTNHLEAQPQSRFLASYLTSSTRSSAVRSACSGLSRTDFSTSNQTAMSSYVASLNSSLGIDGYLYFKSVSPYSNS